MRNSNLNVLIKISLLSVIAFVIMFIEVAVPIFPSFLKLDFSDLPALIGAFSLGPVAGVLIELLKNVLHSIFKGGETAFIGELANFVVGGTLVFVAGAIHKRGKNFTSAIIGLVVGTIVMSIVACVFNYFVLLPFYEKTGFPISAIIAMSAAVNGKINSLFTLILYVFLPFNLLKGLIASVITLAVYKKIVPILSRQQNDTYAA
ncbi:MAG: ECF transporter S component [Clostridiaceae bacterium]